MKFNNKIFGIGLSKTATCSLTSLLRIGFGLNILHDPVRIYNKQLSLERLGNDPTYLDGETGHRPIDGITDLQASILYKQLDNIYPTAKFILTIRDETNWIESINHNWSNSIGLNGQFVKSNSNRFKFGWMRILRHTITMRMWGTTTWSSENVLSVYRKHKHDVISYFKFKDNLLVVDLTSDTHAISKIEKFLNKKCQLKEIPWKNRR
jgi:hypothetical protein